MSEYTDCIENGGSFAEYVWRCAREVGDNVIMAGGEPITDYAPRVSVVTALHKAQKHLARLLVLSTEDKGEIIIARYANALKTAKENHTWCKMFLERCGAVRAQVLSWQPPTEEHVSLKQFMLVQLDLQIARLFSEVSRIVAIEQLSREEWLQSEIEKARQDVADCEVAYREEEAATARCNAWNEALRKSVPQPKDDDEDM